MSCGHAVTPETLTEWCRTKLEEGDYIFTCPALVNGTQRCNKRLSYTEVRRLADLSREEMQYFEENIAHKALAKICEIQSCPQCKTVMERQDSSNLCVQCTICTASKGSTFIFCWQCLRPWKGHAPRNDRCQNKGCGNKEVQLLQTCNTIDLPAVKGATCCPSIRACPSCGQISEHNQKFCKNIQCPRCRLNFCFICLKSKKECSKTTTPFQICSTGVAPRQTSIPKWYRK